MIWRQFIQKEYFQSKTGKINIIIGLKILKLVW